MKRLFLLLGIVCHVPSPSQYTMPVAGRPYTVTYDAARGSIFSTASSLQLVYAFDYWGTRAHQKLRGERGEDDLFLNVLTPDEGRSFTADMRRNGKVWTAAIDIPQDAQLLSYYVTDGTRRDDNDRKTFVEYVHDDKGLPVRGARLRNVDFLIMAGRSVDDVTAEIESEIVAYPDNLLAHVVLWRFRIFDTIDTDTLGMFFHAVNDHFESLYDVYGDTVLNYKIMSLNDINRVVMLNLMDRLSDPKVSSLLSLVNTRINEDAELLPMQKMHPRVFSIREQTKFLLMSPEERERLREESMRRMEEMFAEFVGEPAPDFEFETLSGEKHALSDYRGQYVLLDFWGSWCGPCVAEIPTLVRAYEAFGDRGIVMISVSNDAAAKRWNRDSLAAYTRERSMDWIQVLDDRDSRITKLYKISFWPNVFLIGTDGTVLQRKDLRGAQLEERLAELLGQ